jgi:hypothetical protein
MSDRGDDQFNEGLPLPIEETTAPAFATIRLVDSQPSHGAQDLRWHPELSPGMQCPLCREHPLKRHKSTVFCGTCKQRWWSKRPQ